MSDYSQLVRRTPKGLLLRAGQLVVGDNVYPISLFIQKVNTKDGRTVYTFKPTWLEFKNNKWERKFGNPQWLTVAQYNHIVRELEKIEKQETKGETAGKGLP